MTDILNKAVGRKPKQASQILFDFCGQNDAKQSESGRDSSSDDKDSDPSVVDRGKDASFAETLSLSGDQTLSSLENF